MSSHDHQQKSNQNESQKKAQPDSQDIFTEFQTPVATMLSPTFANPRNVLQLQRIIGNRATSQLLHQGKQSIIQREFDENQEQQWATISKHMTTKWTWSDSGKRDEIIAALRARAEGYIPILEKISTAIATEPSLKIEFTKDDGSGGGHYDFKSHTVELMTNTIEGMADTLVFELGNVNRKEGFETAGSQLSPEQKKGWKYIENPGFNPSLAIYGRQMAGLEAGTMIEYLQSLAGWIDSGKDPGTLPSQAKATYDHFKSDYFDKSTSEREAFLQNYEATFASSPHSESSSQARMRLDSGDLYSYQKIVDEKQVNGTVAFVFGALKAVGITFPNRTKFLESLGIKSITRDIPSGAIGKFYMEFLARVKAHFAQTEDADKVNSELEKMKFNAAQETVAEEEYSDSGYNIASAFQS